MIDKLMENHWFMKVVALVLAVLLFSSVPTPEDEGGSEVNVPGENNTETIEDIPVKSYYDTENLVVSGVPETVNVTIEGPKQLVQQTRTLKNFEVLVDLSEAEIGTQTVELLVRDISDKLQVTIEPAYAEVSVQERVTREFPVEAEFNQSLLEEGYISEQPTVEPDRVKITGAKDVIDRISFVKATIDARGPIDQTITEKASIRALDRELNKLDVIVEPEAVEVTVPVRSTSKTVPINIVQTGTPPEGITIQSITLDTDEARIFASPNILDHTENVRVEVDVSGIRSNSTMTLPVIISEGITSVKPATVEAAIRVTVAKQEVSAPEDPQANNEERRTLPDISIRTQGLNEKYNMAFLDPASAAVNLTVIGPRDAVTRLTAGDFNLFIDASNLGEGEHQLNIQINGPNNVKWELSKAVATVSISQKEA
ncbi:CdaR family protein [Bacillus canaveralius]|uniref:CdaR family protein n=1 Tax=Bacillus canaveralius TaxID=1403243 RepID=UPI000F7B4E11|nr:CdaR family protein [Bacillus canaveralius]RSK44980.1 YbbR-like domain-containing protein [Bacillus canaveralius]